MLSVCKFSNWNPSHFLDTVEMTFAVSLGYNWLYDNLMKDTRENIRRCNIDNGINPSFKSPDNDFLHKKTNWN